jgi:hypothetical protein
MDYSRELPKDYVTAVDYVLLAVAGGYGGDSTSRAAAGGAAFEARGAGTKVYRKRRLARCRYNNRVGMPEKCQEQKQFIHRGFRNLPGYIDGIRREMKTYYLACHHSHIGFPTYKFPSFQNTGTWCSIEYPPGRSDRKVQDETPLQDISDSWQWKHRHLGHHWQCMAR